MDLSIGIALAGIALAIAGVAYGIWWTKREARKSARSTLHVKLVQHFELRASSYKPDLSKVLKISWAGNPIDNLVCLGLTLRLEGYHDHDDPSAKTPPAPGAPSRPRVDFQNLRLLSIGTMNNDPNLFEVPIAKANADKSIFLNIVRLRANVNARFTIVGTKPNEDIPISASPTPGYMKQTDLCGAGLLEDT